jgi:hypothetical protein
MEDGRNGATSCFVCFDKDAALLININSRDKGERLDHEEQNGIIGCGVPLRAHCISTEEDTSSKRTGGIIIS